ncbi:MAG: BCCT family transporter, partial [Gemmatimonadetes bacterium]|nr:BCCT family transporter [Gemmatimonadota bacterium]
MRNGPHRRTTADAGPWKGLNPAMALAAKGVVLAFVLATVRDVDAAGAVFGHVRAWIEGTLDWFYILTVAAAVITCVFLACSRFGRIRLGDDASAPEFKTSSWIAMLFSAGIGIGMLFFSISEPLFHFDNLQSAGYPNNPSADLAGAVLLDEQRAVHAMRVTYFHWGIHGWSVYVVVGLCLAYFGFRRKLPLTLRSALYPLIGERIYGPIGDLVDLLAVFGGVFGIATSLGLGASQMATGLDVLFGVEPGVFTQVALIAAISLAATLSAVSGVSRGIRVLSEWNIRLSLVLLGCFLLLGPFSWLAGFVASSFGEYVWRLVPMSFWIADDPGDAAWQNSWTIFYWGWWISWAPFVGTFIARISRG